MADPYLEQYASSAVRDRSGGADDDDDRSYAAQRRRRANSQGRHSRRGSRELFPTGEPVPPMPTMFPSTSNLPAIEDEPPSMAAPHASSRRRRRHDSVESWGSSVMPAALPHRGSSNQMHSSYLQQSQPQNLGRSNWRDPLLKKAEADDLRRDNYVPPSSAAGMESWLRSSQGLGHPQRPSHTTTYNSLAPAGRFRRMGSDAGSAAGEGSIGGRSQGRLSSVGGGKGGTRRYRSDVAAGVTRSRANMPLWEGDVVEVDEAGVDGSRMPEGAIAATGQAQDVDGMSATESLLRWRTSSALPSNVPISGQRGGHRRRSESLRQYDNGSIASASVVGRGGVPRSPQSVRSIRTGGIDGPSGSRPVLARQRDSTPLRTIVRGLMKEGVSASTVILGGCVFAIFTHWFLAAVAAAGHSRRGWETLRHWMALTGDLPLAEWYTFDLDHVVLDRPPLMAWSAGASGRILSSFADTRTALRFPPAKLDTIATSAFHGKVSLVALTCEVLFYLPAVIFFVHRRLADRSRRTRVIAALTAIFQPIFSLANFGIGGLQGLTLSTLTLSLALLYTSLPNAQREVSSKAAGASAARERHRQLVTSLSRHVSYQYVGAFAAFLWAIFLDQNCFVVAPAVLSLVAGRCLGLGLRRGLSLMFGLLVVTALTAIAIFWPWLDVKSTSGLEQIWLRISGSGGVRTEARSVELLRAMGLAPQQLTTVAWSITAILSAFPCLILLRAARETVSIEMLLHEDLRKDVDSFKTRTPSAPRAESIAAGSERVKSARVPNGAPLPSASRKARSTRASSVAPSEAASDLRSFAESIVKGGAGANESLAMSGRPAGIAGQHQEDEDVDRIASSCPSPSASILPYACTAIGLAFQLFAPPFSTTDPGAIRILLSVLPLTLLMVTKGDEWGGGANKTDWQWAALGNNTAVYLLWPSVVAVPGLVVPSVVSVLAWNWIIGHRPLSSTEATEGWVGVVSLWSHRGMALVALLSTMLRVIIRAEQGPLMDGLSRVVASATLFALYFWALKRTAEVAIATGLNLGFGSSRSEKSKKAQDVI